MKTKIEMACAWSGPLFVVLYVIAFWGMAGYLPPHPPSLSLEDVAQFYDQNRNMIRGGQLIGLVLSTMLFPWFGLISIQMARIEGRSPILAVMQFGGGALLIVFFMICAMMWEIAAFRAELDPQIIRMLHEGSWLVFVMIYPAYTLQMICIALTGFMDKRADPWLPRWLCYFHLWVGISAIGGGFATFFKSGPFAWNGLFGFWVPVSFFVVWLFLMAPRLMREVKRRALEDGVVA